MSDRSHPVRLLLDHLAIGGTLTPEDLTDIRLSEDVDRAPIDRAIRDAAARIAEKRELGQRGDARRIALQYANEIIDQAGPVLPDQRVYPDDPYELASLIKRR